MEWTLMLLARSCFVKWIWVHPKCIKFEIASLSMQHEMILATVVQPEAYSRNYNISSCSPSTENQQHRLKVCLPTRTRYDIYREASSSEDARNEWWKEEKALKYFIIMMIYDCYSYHFWLKRKKIKRSEEGKNDFTLVSSLFPRHLTNIPHTLTAHRRSSPGVEKLLSMWK